MIKASKGERDSLNDLDNMYEILQLLFWRAAKKVRGKKLLRDKRSYRKALEAITGISIQLRNIKPGRIQQSLWLLKDTS